MTGKLYCDGGVIGGNPSGIGGTWAARLTDYAGQVIREESGVITVRASQMLVVTNNLTEMLALLKGLSFLPAGWTGTVCSDSQITLGRAFLGWKWSGIPNWMHVEYQRQHLRILRWDQLNPVLHDGHPTKAQLAAGIGKRGHPVSEHNVWCDKACTAAGQAYLARAEAYTVNMAVPA